MSASQIKYENNRTDNIRYEIFMHMERIILVKYIPKKFNQNLSFD